MKKKMVFLKLLVWLIVLLFFIVYLDDVIAVYGNYSYEIHYWDMEDGLVNSTDRITSQKLICKNDVAVAYCSINNINFPFYANTGSGSDYSLENDGNNNYHEISGIFPQDLNNKEFSISFWVYLDNTLRQSLFFIYNNIDTTRFIMSAYKNGNYWFRAYNGSIGCSFESTFGFLSVGWRNLVCTYGVNNFKCYVDNVNIVNISHSDNCLFSDMDKARFGRFVAGEWSGEFDEIRVFDFVLTDSQIEEIYYNGTIFISIPKVEIIIHNLLNNSNQTDNPLDFDFEIKLFNSTICSLYSNISGDFESVDNILANITPAYNITTENNINYTDESFETPHDLDGIGNILAVDFDINLISDISSDIKICYYGSQKTVNEIGNISINNTDTGIIIPLPLGTLPTTWTCINVDKNLFYDNWNRIGIKCTTCSVGSKIYLSRDDSTQLNKSFTYLSGTWSQEINGEYGIKIIYNTTEFFPEIQHFLNNSINHTLSHLLPDNTTTNLQYFIECNNNMLPDVNVTSNIITIHYNNDFTPPEIDILFPIFNESYNIDVPLNFTTSEYSLCSVNNVYWTLYYTDGFNHFYNDISPDNEYTLNITCEDIAFNQDSVIITFFKDKITPNIYWIIPSDLNNSVLEYNITQQFNITLFDLNLFGYNITFYNSDGETRYSKEVIDIDVINLTITPEVFLNETGKWNVILNVSDSHTANKINNFEIEKGLDYLMFDNHIKITAKDSISSDTSKSIDRYNFEFTYSKGVSNNKIFYVESNKKLHYIEDSKYIAHFVDYDNGKWIDFDGLGIKPIIDKINDNKYRIIFKSDKETIVFNSIGGLNSVTENVTFLVKYFPPPFEPLGLFEFDMTTTTNIMLLFILMLFYISLMALAFVFKNFGFASFGFFIGIILGLMFAGLHIFLTLLFFLINIFIFIKYAHSFK